MSPCIVCKNLKKNEDDFRLAFDFVPSELIKSAKATKCVACKLLLDGILRFEEESWNFSRDVTRVYANGLTKKQSDTLSVEVYFNDDRPKLVLEFYNKQGKDASGDEGINWKPIRSRTAISGHALSPAAMDWSMTRLKVCERKHSCHSHSATTLPKRTLSFQKLMDGKIDVRLVESDMEKGRYIALSHCWGSVQHCTLTSRTLPEFKSSIPWHILPKTFQDAIIFSTKLDVYYIWIDALCIIQDDPTDWEIESAKMADIYQDSYLTLAATGSSNDVGGCFPPGESATIAAEYQLSVRRSLFHSHHIMARKKVTHWAWPPSKASANVHPLLSRGWAFQERILSPRVLHFCKEELLWECRGETVCECGSLPGFPEMKKHFFVARNPEEPEPSDPHSNISLPEPEPSSGFRTGYAAESTGNFGRATTASSISRPFVESDSQRKEKVTRHKLWRRVFKRNKVKNVHESEAETLEQRRLQEEWKRVVRNISVPDAAENWHRIIEQYSALNLTVQTDRLPALSGLAVRSSPILGRYLSGLWKDNLVSDLMWRVNLLEVGIGRGGDYISPSWSWASITGPVTYWTEAENEIPKFPEHQLPPVAVGELEDRVRLISVSGKVEIIGTNPYGRIGSGTLIVDGYLKPAQLRWVSTRTGGSGGNSEVKVEPVPLKYDLEINPAVTNEHNSAFHFPYLELPFFADYILREDGPHQIPDNGSLTLLLLHPSICLVLRAVEDQAMTYRRVGIVRQPWEQVSIYDVDWMFGSRFMEGIRII